MKVYLFIDEIDGTAAGTEKQLVLLIRELVSRGHDVRLFVLRPTAFSDTVSDFPCPIECLGIYSIASLSTLRRLLWLRRRLKIEKPDVVHGYFNDCAMIVPLAASVGGCRVYTSRRDMGYWYTASILRSLRFVNRFCTAIVCNSDAVAANVMRHEAVPRHRTVVIYNGLATAVPEHNDEDLPELDTTKPGINICLLANIRPIKRMEDAIGALQQARHAGCDVQLYIIGKVLDEDYWACVRQRSTDAGMSEFVHWVGQVSNPRRFVRRCDIGILTSGSEGFSNAVLEYFAEGLPVVCTDAGGSSELIQNGATGFICTVGDVPALARRIVELGSDPALRERLGSAARSVAQEFSVEKYVQNHLSLYGNKAISG